jgi:hypothetical protein
MEPQRDPLENAGIPSLPPLDCDCSLLILLQCHVTTSHVILQHKSVTFNMALCFANRLLACGLLPEFITGNNHWPPSHVMKNA